MIPVVVYDLNKTLYRKSSKNEFFKFICKKNPAKVFHIFRMLGIATIRGLGFVDKTRFKQHFYCYLNHIPPEKLENYTREFWEKEFPENFRKKMLDDILKFKSVDIEVYIITGAYEVYTKYLESKLPVKVLGTIANYEEGVYRIKGKACNNEEKIRRLNEDVKGKYRLLEAYSDDREEILFQAETGYFLNREELKKL